MYMTIAWRYKNGSRAESNPRHAPEAGLPGTALLALRPSVSLTQSCVVQQPSHPKADVPPRYYLYIFLFHFF